MDITNVHNLKSVRGGYRSAVTRLLSQQMSTDDIVLKQNLTKAETYEQKLQDLDVQIASLLQDSDDIERDVMESIDVQEKISDFKVLLVANIQKLEVLAEQMRDSSSARSDARASTTGAYYSAKLPKLELAKFQGDPLEWTAFWDMFESSVHSNTTLSDVDKFTYLKSLLQGQACGAIAGLAVTNANYSQAVDLLHERFGQKQLIINAHIEALIDVPNAAQNSKLRSTFDEAEKHIRGLEALGITSETYGIVIAPMLLKKFPNDIRLIVSRNQKDAVWELGKLRQQLKNEIEARERSLLSSSSKGNKSTSDNQMTVGALVTQAKQCVFCDGDHAAYQCSLDPDNRWIKAKEKRLCFVCLRNNHSARQCRSKNKCRKCQRGHHTTLCNPMKAKTPDQKNTNVPITGTKVVTENSKQNEGQANASRSIVNTCILREKSILMQTAQVQAVSEKSSCCIHVLLDSGSQRSFINMELAEKLACKVQGFQSLSLTPFSQQDCKKTTYKVVKLGLKTKNGDVKFIKAIAVPKITGPVSRDCIAPQHLRYFQECMLAEPYMLPTEMVNIDILIGLDHLWEIVSGRSKKVASSLMAIDTDFGWVFSGRNSLPDKTVAGQCMVNKILVSEYDTAKDMWSLDSIGIKEPISKEPNQALTSENEMVEQMFRDSLVIKEDRYYVSFPAKENMIELPSNEDLAKARLQGLIKRLTKQPNMLKEYDAVIQEQLKRQFIESVQKGTIKENQAVHYISHHPVIKEDSATTKLRIVYNASARIDGHSPSLNDVLHKGPDLMGDLFGILMRFRENEIGITADIEKAFLMVGLNEKDRDLTRFFWMANPTDPASEIVTYRFCRVPFGVISSPFLLNQTVKYHLEQSKANSSKLLLKNFYMDNAVVSLASTEDAKKFYTDIKASFNEAGMNIREWTSNDKTLKESIKGVDLVHKQQVKVLGLKWDVENDTLSVKADIKDDEEYEFLTKRRMLHLISKVFDPHGWLTPLTIKSKSLMQKIWLEKIKWDESVSLKAKDEAKVLMADLKQVGNFKLKRSFCIRSAKEIELHVFADACPKAYAAVAYLRLKVNQSWEIQLLCAKSRVAPLKEQKLPRLELLGILIAVRLAEYVKLQLSFTIASITVWSDSQIALWWIKTKKPLKQFVRNRVEEIKLSKAALKYVNTKSNPADLACRGISHQKLMNSTLWWKGPPWLNEDTSNWPETNTGQLESLPEYSKEICHVNVVASDLKKGNPTREKIWPVNLIKLERFSSLNKLLRVTATVQRARQLFRKQNEQSLDKTLDLVQGQKDWDKAVQIDAFADEFKLLENNKSNQLIRQLGLFIDNDGLLRCKGRLENADVEETEKFPKLLPKSHWYTRLVILHYHKMVLHSGLQHTLNTLRSEFWILQGRQAVKNVISKCTLCKRWQGKPFAAPNSPPLPPVRIKRTIPFENTGLDYLGPVYTKREKVWICLFTCAVTRAIHLELVSDMTTKEFLLCFRRFVARCGTPTVIISDNAKTFKLAKPVIEKMWEEVIKDPDVHDYVANHKVKWVFNVERAPWWGGFFERLVGSVKRLLKKAVGKASLNKEELVTYLHEVEAILNSRPLTYVYDDVDGEVLTPNKLCGIKQEHGIPSSVTVNDEDYLGSQENPVQQMTRRMRYAQKLQNKFWDQWCKEYMQMLREQHSQRKEKKASNQRQIVVGDVVLIKDDLPRARWKMGTVTSLITGRDGNVRAAVLKTAASTLQRPLQLICPLEVYDFEPEVDRIHSAEVNLNPKTGISTRPQARAAAMKATAKIFDIAKFDCEGENGF